MNTQAIRTEPAHPAPRAVVLAFEGVLAPVDVLPATLEPRAREELGPFLEQRADDPLVRRILADLRAYAGREMDEAELRVRIDAWIRAGQDISPLRQLQGLIWTEILEQGALRPELDAETVVALTRLAQAGVALYSFGATPVTTQREWLRRGPDRNFEARLAGYFDTRMGGRRDAGSFGRLVAETGLQPEQVLVLSPDTRQLDAARQGWLRTACPAVPDEAATGTDDTGDHPIASLAELAADWGRAT